MKHGSGNSSGHALITCISNSQICLMPSAVDLCKRALVSLIRALASAYGCRVAVTRDSPDQDVKRGYRTLSKKTHPDRGGSTQDQQRLNEAYEAWCNAARSTNAPGRPTSDDNVRPPPPGPGKVCQVRGAHAWVWI